GQVGWRPSFADGRLELTAGVRYTQDDKNLHSRGVSTTTTTTVTTQTAANSWDNTGWSASASYKLFADVMAYVSASSAYRAGGYNGPTVGAPPFGPETSRSYEAGLKSDWLDHHVRLNLTIYQTNYQDLQVNQFNSTTLTNVIANAAKVR